jgi:hypothetical protein
MERGELEPLSTLRSWFAAGKWTLVVRLAAVGAFAGLAAWGVAYAAHPLFDASRPSTIGLLLAILRGAFFGVVLAWILHVYWTRRDGRDGRQEKP